MPNSFINSQQGHNKNFLISSCNKVQNNQRKIRGNDSVVGTNKVSSHKNLYWDLVRFQNKFAPNKTMRLCNRSPITHSTGIKNPLIVKNEGKKAHFGNLMTCKNFFCPNCSEVFRTEQRTKARLGIDNAIKAGFDVRMVTFTIPREFGNNNFSNKFDVMNKAFKAVINALRTRIKGKKFLRENGETRLWTMKGIDVTMDSDRADPCHLHIHSLIITDKKIPDLRDWLWRTYKRHMEKRGIRVVKKAFDVRQILEDKEITDYIVKTLGTIERELTSTRKDGRDGKSKGWFSWLCSIVENPSRRDIYLYQEFLRSAKGKRTQDFSRNWNELMEIKINSEPIEIKIETEEEKIEETKSFYWVLDLQLWNAIKETKTEELILKIVDDFIDKGINRDVFLRLDEIVRKTDYRFFGEEKKLFYCELLKDVVGFHYTKT